MQTFESIASLEALRHSPLCAILKQLVVLTTEDQPDYRPEDDDYFVLIKPGDVDRVLSDLDMPWHLTDVPWEGAQMRDGHYYAVYLGTDAYGMGFVIPDAAWVNGDPPGELRSLGASFVGHVTHSNVTVFLPRAEALRNYRPYTEPNAFTFLSFA